MKTKRCTQCGETKPLSKFTKWKGGKDKHRSYCKACDSKYQRNYSSFTAKGRYHKLLRTAKRDGTDLTLTVDDVTKLYNQNTCYYCNRGVTIGFGHKHKLTDRTVDRRDNAKGYIVDNVVIACRRCNLMKGNWFTAEQTLEIAKHYLSL